MQESNYVASTNPLHIFKHTALVLHIYTPDLNPSHLCMRRVYYFLFVSMHAVHVWSMYMYRYVLYYEL